MVLEISSTTDRIFCDFGPFFVLLPPPSHRAPPLTRNNPKNQNFEKMKKIDGDIITLLLCTKSDNHIMYGS